MRQLLERLQAALEHRIEAEELFPEVRPEQLDAVYERRFRRWDRDRFHRLWCKLSFIVGRTPFELHENDSIMDLCEYSDSPKYLGVAGLVSDRARKHGLPDVDLRTVGALIDWLLNDSETRQAAAKQNEEH